jgi:hypothetical protein
VEQPLLVVDQTVSEETESEASSCDEDFEEQQYHFLREQISELLLSQEQDVSSCFSYDGLSFLKTDLDVFFMKDLDSPIQVSICAYHVNQRHKHPFLEYFLLKDTAKDTLFFPQFDYVNSMNVIGTSIGVLERYSACYQQEPNYVYKGYLYEDGRLFVFYDCSGMKLDGFRMSRSNDLWMVTVDEIVNLRHVCGFSVQESVADFFLDHLDFLSLRGKDGRPIESPSVMYHGVARKKLDLATNFGVPSAGKDGEFGDNFYFTDYVNAVRMSGWLPENGGQGGGIVRCAVFLGHMKAPSEATDEDGIWSLNYDSLYIGEVARPDGRLFEEYPLWVIKSYDQQVVLSGQVLDKSVLGPSWSREAKYLIA